MWKSGNRAWYGFTSVNDGLVTSSGSISRLEASPLTKTVLPAPSGPSNNSISPPRSCAPTCAASAKVSWALCDSHSPVGMCCLLELVIRLKTLRILTIRIQSANSLAKVFSDVGSDHRAHAQIARCEIAGQAANIQRRNRRQQHVGFFF